jgi:PAS domain S-box-containing protein
MKMDRKVKRALGSEKLKASDGARRSSTKPNGKHLPAAYEHIPIGIVESSLEGKYINANEEFCNIVAYEKQELLTLGIKDLTFEEDYPIDINLHQQLIAGKIPFYKLEKRYVRKDGEIAWVELTRSIVRNSHGKALYTVGAVLDVTERKRADLEIKNISRLPAENPNQLMRLTPDGKILYANNAATSLLDFWKQQNDQTIPSKFQKQVAEAFASGLKKEIEIEQNGKTFSCTLVPIREAGYVNFYGNDITERKLAEEKLRASEALYKAIARSIPGGGVYVVDKNLRYLVADGVVTEAFGLSSGMLEGHTVSEIFSGEQKERLEERLRRAFTGETVSSETERNGRIYWSQYAPLVDSIGQVIVVTLDITERKQIEEALRQSEERFARFMQHLPALAWIKDVQGNYVYANAAAEKAFRTPREKLYGKTDQDIFPAEVAAQFKKNDEQALMDGKDVQVIETLEHEDGVLHHSLVSKFPIPGLDGNTALIGGTAFDITERKQIEEALRESEERFRAIVNQATAGIVRKDTDGKLMFVNQAFCEMLGYTESELVGKTIWQLTYNQDVEENKRLFERMMAEGASFQLEKRLIRRDGSILWVNVSVSPVLDSAGKPQSAVAVEVDITGRKQAEEALQQLNLQLESRVQNRTEKLTATLQTLRDEMDERKEAEEQLAYQARLIANVNDAIIATDEDLVVNYWNQAAEQIYGWKAEEVMGRTASEVLQSEFLDGNTRSKALQKVNEIGELRTAVTHLRKDGTRIFVEARTSTLRNEDGKTIGYIGINRDVTERKRAEQALRESEATARLLLNTAPDGVIIVNETGVVVHANAQIASLFGYQPEEVLGKLVEVLIPERFHERHQQHRRAYANYRSRRVMGLGMELFGRRKSGIEFPVDVMLTPISNIPEWDLMVTIRDNTEGKQMERALHESRRRLQILSQRLVEVQEEERRAIARELHDRVGQSLSALNINLVIMNDQISKDSKKLIGSRLDDSLHLVSETIALVRDVMSNLRPAVLDDYGLEAALQSYIDEFKFRYGIQVVLNQSDKPISRLGASLEMTFLRIAQEALMNIARHAQASQVTLSLRQENNAICLTVQDNGIGIESWQEANRPGSHGLTIMRERAEAFGGNLKVRSVPSKGTKIEVSIPIENGSQTQVQKEMRG